MHTRPHSPTHLMVFWPLVALAVLARLTFGGIVFPMSVFDDPAKDLTRLSILCDDKVPLSDPNRPHHHSTDPQDDGFLLSDGLELFQPTIALCIFGGLAGVSIHRVWNFPPIRGPPAPERTSLCPQGPPPV
ncbi:hypothetical protein [Acetobacter oeni]|uniref:Uncharacterized protein n=1 Tax=Acetobacter oeni TaxID=304077 RepID=A0A511XNE2_9PROT|nr:hypothetical protein [Acetobacter oeni]MBB3884358.1 hypothetical protein [Acetobacter oeni]NHO20290.1 hypothetical protein [Acetobacter oeni]GBR05310.1 hypothetical protein AA21952_1691 [Acetobacter oeni LMG 21952]GEN64463.1 hypothetical protein AOE01nite_26870 [Acetobacter oeni]